MRAVLTPDPAPTPDDELAKAAGDAWWAPLTARLLDELDPEPDDPAPAPGR